MNDSNKNEIIKLFTEHIITSGQVFGIYLGLAIELTFTFFSAMIISLIFDWRLGLICIGFIVVLVANLLVYYYFSSKLKVDKLTNDYFSETIANIKLIKAFNLKENLLKFLIAEESKIRTKNTVSNHLLHYFGTAVYFVITYIELALLNYFGGIFVIEQEVSTIGSFTGSTSLLFIYLMIDLLIMKYISDFYSIHQSIEKLNKLINPDLIKEKSDIIKNNQEIITQSSPNDANYEPAAYERVTNIHHQKNNINIKIVNKPKTELQLKGLIQKNCYQYMPGKIEFRNVSFSYSLEKNKQKVLNDVSFTITPGTRVGFVGPSGSGKSTIIQLLLRFYEPSEGEIFLDGINIKDFDIRNLRDLFSGVFQEPDLFERSIYENIQYGNLNASDEEIAAVALIAQIPLSLLDYKSNQSIMQISGGQKQRIAIARCLLKQRKFYFFDEATSALDINTEKKIVLNLENYFKDLEEKKTILTVAHRYLLYFIIVFYIVLIENYFFLLIINFNSLINIQNADCIFVLKDGQLIEQGNHKILLKNKGVYRELWEKEKSQK